MFQTVKNLARRVALTAALSGAAASQEPKPTTPEAPAKTSVKAESLEDRLKSALNTLISGVTAKPAQEPKTVVEKKPEPKKEEPKPEVKEGTVSSDFKQLSSREDFELASADVRLRMQGVLEAFGGFRKVVGLCNKEVADMKWAAMSETIAPEITYNALIVEHIRSELNKFLSSDAAKLTKDEIDLRKQFAPNFMAPIEEDLGQMLKEVRFSAINKPLISAYLTHYFSGSPEMEKRKIEIQSALGIDPNTGNSGEADYFAKTIAQAEEAHARQQAAAAALSGQTVIAKPQDTESDSTLRNLGYLARLAAIGATAWGIYRIVK